MQPIPNARELLAKKISHQTVPLNAARPCNSKGNPDASRFVATDRIHEGCSIPHSHSAALIHSPEFQLR